MRRFDGKGTNLTSHRTDDLRKIGHRINTRSGYVHDWPTAHDLYTSIAMTD